MSKEIEAAPTGPEVEVPVAALVVVWVRDAEKVTDPPGSRVGAEGDKVNEYVVVGGVGAGEAAGIIPRDTLPAWSTAAQKDVFAHDTAANPVLVE